LREVGPRRPDQEEGGKQVRVLHLVATAQRRGAEVFAGDLVHAFRPNGVEQLVVVLDGTGARAVTFDAQVAFLDGGARAGWRAQPRTIARLRDVVRRWRPDVIQAHGGEPLFYATLAGVSPIVYRKIGGAHPRFSRGPFRALYSQMLRRADRIVAVADAMRLEVIERFGVPPARVTTIPHAVDPRRIAPTRTRVETRAHLGLSASSPVVMSLGALTWEKDPLTALSATAPTLGARSDAVHLFVGDGPVRERLVQEIGARGLEGRVRLLGVREDVGDLLAASDVLVLSSRIEGLPGCIVEAGMLGVPTAAFAVAGVPEVVSDGETGLLAEPGDVTDLAEKLRALIDDDTLRVTLGGAARAMCSSRFEIGSVAPRYLDTYGELVGRPGAALERWRPSRRDAWIETD
jgi:glycosyltransferase involved in cell wall biosynthesis